MLLFKNIYLKSFSTNHSAKIMKVIYENGKKKIVYEDFSSETFEKTRSTPKLKVFGLEVDENPLENHIERPTEAIEENLIKTNQFYSDYARIYIKAGDGGRGCFSFDKGLMKDIKTPDGGNGGKGGDVIFVADENVNSLSKLRMAHYLGNNGQNGKTKKMGGKDSKPSKIFLPLGTIVNEIVRPQGYQFKKRDLKKEESSTRFLVDLDKNGKEYLICKGGQGGFGNSEKRNITKGDSLLLGGVGEEKELELILKCAAEVCLVGFPNSGKSTLLASLTRACPKIAPYAFTTMFPHLGKLRFSDTSHISMADLPGLIEGSHKNKGLGHKFLKHIERVKLIIFVLDGSLAFGNKRSPSEDIIALKEELRLYKSELANKEFIIALNKYDDSNVKNFEENYLKLKEMFPNTTIVKISAKEKINLEFFVESVKKYFITTEKTNLNKKL